jgi:hypothetical protein
MAAADEIRLIVGSVSAADDLCLGNLNEVTAGEDAERLLLRETCSVINRREALVVAKLFLQSPSLRSVPAGEVIASAKLGAEVNLRSLLLVPLEIGRVAPELPPTIAGLERSPDFPA